MKKEIEKDVTIKENLQHIKDAIHILVYGSVFNGYSMEEVRIFEEIEKLVQQGSLSKEKDVLELIKFNLVYRIRGNNVDIETQENKDYFRGMQDGYRELLGKCRDIKYLISAVNKKYLNDDEKKVFEELRNRIYRSQRTSVPQTQKSLK